MAQYSVLTYWEVLAVVFFGIVFFNEAITWNMVVGGLLIISASLLLRKCENEKY
jgi:drug/metabolite transporter (DMT)-like permease